MLDRASPLPLYFQLRTALLEQIENGTLKPGDTLPTEREMIDRYRVSRITIRQAVNSLMSDGLLYRQRGLGTFVRSDRIEQELSTLTGFSEEMTARGLNPGATVISAEMVDPDAAVVSKLRLRPGQKAFRMVRLRLADGEPMALDITHCPPDLGEKLLAEDLQGALYALLEEKYGVELDQGDQAIQATQADGFLAEQLGIKKGMPILQMERVVFAMDGRPVEFSRTCYRADRYVYRVHLRRNRNPRISTGPR